MNMDKYGLISRSKEELITLVSKLMDKLTEKERLEFVSKWISPQAALEEADACDCSSFWGKVESFCKECLDGKYVFEPDYEQYHDDDDDYDDEETYDYSESEWAEKFSALLKLSVMYSRNKNYDISYTAFEKLMNCLHEAEFDEDILGTENPMDYIEIDWEEVFKEYYLSMRNQLSDKKQLAYKAVDVWMNFGERCTNSILNNINDITHIEESIRKNIADNMDCWLVQHQLYELLKSFYLKLGLEFNEIMIAKSLVCYNPNFLNDAAQGYINCEMWDEAVRIIKEALKEVTNEQLVSALNKKMVDCYESLDMFSEAYDVAAGMFISHNSHELYLKARSIAIRIGNLENFIENMENHIRANKRYDSIFTLLRILSFEGHTLQLIETALKSDDYSRHDYLKYTSKSLIYRALGFEKIILPDLKEFLQSIEDNKITGIADMIKISVSSEDKQFLLNSTIEILKQMVLFHINAAQRSRYARAAYYCAVIKDIYIYKNEKDEFNQYYGKILMENNRRPALKDEMKKKLF